MAGKQKVSLPVVIIVMFAVLLSAYFLFFRAELAPPGVELIHDHEEEELDLPKTPPADPEQMQMLSATLMPLGAMCVFPPLVEDRVSGARIAMVAIDGPAHRAGMLPGDLVVRFGEWETTNPFALGMALTKVEPDKVYEVVVVRGKEELKLAVTGIVPLPPEEQMR